MEQNNNKKSFWDKFFTYFVGGFFFVFGIIFLLHPLIDIIRSGKFDVVPDIIIMGVIFFLIGSSMLFPQKFGKKIGVIITSFFSYLYKGFVRITGIKGDPFENKYFQAILSFSFAALNFFNMDIFEKRGGIVEIVPYIGIPMFTILGVYSLFPNFTKIMGIILVWIIAIGVAIGILILIAKSVGAIPLSIIIGAIIIASAIKRKK
ncbi:MAG: hypothetical protein SFT90_05775 [Rickettsiales bacterium]|nr:hypothetical protein [Rickettsiales bacterium]